MMLAVLLLARVRKYAQKFVFIHITSVYLLKRIKMKIKHNNQHKNKAKNIKTTTTKKPESKRTNEKTKNKKKTFIKI